MIYSLRRSRAATILPRLEILGDRLRVQLIRPDGPVLERSGLYGEAEIVVRDVVDERIYGLSEFSAGGTYLKYFLLHDGRSRLQDPLNVFERCPQGYSHLFEGPSPFYLVSALYQPRPVSSFEEMHFVFSRPAIMPGPFEYYDETEKHAFSHRLMPEPQLESLRLDGESVIVEIALKGGDRRDCEVVLSSAALGLHGEKIELTRGRGRWRGPLAAAGAVELSVGYPHKTIDTKRFQLEP